MKNNLWELFNKCSDELKALALTHSSYANEHGIDSNERVEFLGDSVLSIIVADYLYKHCHMLEGKMSKVRATIVCTKNLARLGRELKLEEKILIGKSYKDEISDSVIEDAVESIVGVLYLTYGLHSISSAVIDALDVKNIIKTGKNEDYKSKLQELEQLKHSKIEYQVVQLNNQNEQIVFRSNLKIDDKFIAFGQGNTKRLAEQNSAYKALKKLGKSKK